MRQTAERKTQQGIKKKRKKKEQMNTRLISFSQNDANQVLLRRCRRSFRVSTYQIRVPANVQWAKLIHIIMYRQRHPKSSLQPVVKTTQILFNSKMTATHANVFSLVWTETTSPLRCQYQYNPHPPPPPPPTTKIALHTVFHIGYINNKNRTPF